MARLHATLTLLGKHTKELPVRTWPFVLGRSKECHLLLKGGVKVSRRHAELRFAEGRFVLVDLGSQNGTRVNGEKITRCILEDGDKIEIGKFELLISLVLEDQDGLRMKPPRNKPAPLPAPRPVPRSTPRPMSRPAPRATPRPAPPSSPAPLVVVVASSPAAEGATDTCDMHAVLARPLNPPPVPASTPPDAPAPVPSAPAGEKTTDYYDMSAVVGPPQGEGGSVIVRLGDLTGVPQSPLPKILLTGGAVAAVALACLLALRGSGGHSAPREFSFEQLCAALQLDATGRPLPEGVRLPGIPRRFDVRMRKGATMEWELLYPVSRFGSSDPEIFSVARVAAAEAGRPEHLSLTALTPGRAQLVLVDRRTSGWFSLGVEVQADGKWPPHWNDQDRRSAAERLKAEADLLLEAADANVPERAKALSRYQKVLRLCAGMSAPPPQLCAEAKERAAEIQKQIAALEEGLSRQVRAAIEGERWEEARDDVDRLLDLFPVEGSPGADEVWGRHGDWEKYRAYRSERARIEKVLRSIDSRQGRK
ncbi:MAG: FHA domain-containing protein [Planctomycetes bacterium]|nr:FHA domain-containing protein [Planctomycetota bacterium]